MAVEAWNFDLQTWRIIDLRGRSGTRELENSVAQLGSAFNEQLWVVFEVTTKEVQCRAQGRELQGLYQDRRALVPAMYEI